MSSNLPKAVKVSSVTITTVTAKCDRCKKSKSGECGYPNYAMFVKNELKFTTIQANRTSKSTFPKEVLVCQECSKDLEQMFEKPEPPKTALPHQEVCIPAMPAHWLGRSFVR